MIKDKVDVADPMDIVAISMERGDVVDVFLMTGVRFRTVVKLVGDDSIAIQTPEGGLMVIRWEAFASLVNNSIALR